MESQHKIRYYRYHFFANKADVIGVVRALAKGTDLNFKNPKHAGKSPLHVCATTKKHHDTEQP